MHKQKKNVFNILSSEFLPTSRKMVLSRFGIHSSSILFVVTHSSVSNEIDFDIYSLLHFVIYT